MKFVVDTNILVSFFRNNPVNELISNSKSLNLQLFTPEYVIDELKKNKPDVLKYAKINEEQFNEKLEELLKFVNIISEKESEKFKLEAEKLIHDKDVPIFALALKLNCPIWSNEPGFKKQAKIEVFSNRDVIELFG
jgi:predicted nucleic acid-binding protein